MNLVAQSTSAASWGSVSLPAQASGGTPAELTDEDDCATLQICSARACPLSARQMPIFP